MLVPSVASDTKRVWLQSSLSRSLSPWGCGAMKGGKSVTQPLTLSNPQVTKHQFIIYTY